MEEHMATEADIYPRMLLFLRKKIFIAAKLAPNTFVICMQAQNSTYAFIISSYAIMCLI